MKYFIDSEFIDDGKTIELISFGMVAEDGRMLYAQNRECDFSKVTKWIVDNVYPAMTNCIGDRFPNYPVPPGAGAPWATRDEIRKHIIDFVHDDPEPEFWGYYVSYDWVVFCQLFGRMIDLPEHWPRYAHDLKLMARDLGNPRLPKPKDMQQHNALHDAWWVKETYLNLCILRDFRASTSESP